MPLEEITLLLFAACNSIRVVAYVPQILKAATDKNGASSISFMTWSLFLLAHRSTVAYALINHTDWGLAACFAVNAICCVAILAAAYWKRRSHAKRVCCTDRPALGMAA
jgi:uncharacterized protein with PQ loop repeat